MNKLTENALRQKLRKLYGVPSKHSSYQSIPAFISNALGYQESIQQNWRGDNNRYEYLVAQLSPQPGERWADFGANTGFFTYSLAHAFPQTSFLAIEANSDHAHFLREVKRAFELTNVNICAESIGIENLGKLRQFDVLLHLNVLHHAGSDFDRNDVVDQVSFQAYAVRYLAQLKLATQLLVLQIGTNLWGNKTLPIFPNTDDSGVLKAFLAIICSAGWNICSIAYPVTQPSGEIVYRNLSPTALAELKKGDSYCDWEVVTNEILSFFLAAHVGEFYHRPLFLLGH